MDRWRALILAAVLLGSSMAYVLSAPPGAFAASRRATVHVCDNITGTKFKVNVKSLTLKSHCASEVLALGSVLAHVTETWAPASYGDVMSISVIPSFAKLDSSTRSATATVMLSRNSSVTVTFTNAKVQAENG
jgi:hypothetical protein